MITVRAMAVPDTATQRPARSDRRDFRPAMTDDLGGS
jgi:hypothetical protein